MKTFDTLTVVAVTSVVDLLPVCDWHEGDVYIVDDKRYVWTGRKWEYLDELSDEEDDTNEHS